MMKSPFLIESPIGPQLNTEAAGIVGEAASQMNYALGTINGWMAWPDAPGAQRWRHAAAFHYGRRIEDEHISQGYERLTPSADRAFEDFSAAAHRLRILTTESVRKDIPGYVVRGISGPEAVRMRREISDTGSTLLKVNSLVSWASTPETALSFAGVRGFGGKWTPAETRGLMVRMPVSRADVWADFRNGDYDEMIVGHKSPSHPIRAEDVLDFSKVEDPAAAADMFVRAPVHIPVHSPNPTVRTVMRSGKSEARAGTGIWSRLVKGSRVIRGV